ncbi:MAG: hypothetical protein ACFFD4_39690, partial [Candidatus Odinarchaeota archaeon]
RFKDVPLEFIEYETTTHYLLVVLVEIEEFMGAGFIQNFKKSVNSFLKDNSIKSHKRWIIVVKPDNKESKWIKKLIHKIVTDNKLQSILISNEGAVDNLIKRISANKHNINVNRFYELVAKFEGDDSKGFKILTTVGVEETNIAIWNIVKSINSLRTDIK